MKLLRNLSTRAKLFNLVMLMVTFLLIVGGAGYWHLNRAEMRMGAMYQDQLLPIKSINDLRAQTRAIEASVYKMILETSPTKQLEIKQQIETRIKDSNQLLTQLEQSNLDKRETAFLQTLKDLNEKYQGDRTRVIQLIEEGNQDEAYNYFRATEATLDGINQELKSWADYNSQTAEDIHRQNTQESREAEMTLIITIGAALLLAMSIGYVIARMIADPLKKVASKLDELAGGDLTVQPVDFEGKDEVGTLGQAFNKLVIQLRSLIGEVKVAASSEQLTSSAEQTAKAAEQAAAAIQEIATGSEVQTQRTAESVRVMEELGTAIQRIAATAGTVSESSVRAAQEAEQGNEYIVKAVEQMSAVQAAVNRAAEMVTLLGARSEAIGEIVQVITGIASQTNLLALNAAIEAARAGEQGRGFAVVADEVRKLAEQSENSAQEIARLIGDIQLETGQVIAAMNQGTAETEAGSVAVREAGMAFQRIVSAAQAVAEQIQEVSAATEQMTAGVQQVASSMDEMNRLAQEAAVHTQGAAANSEEQLASMQEIARSSENLNRLSQQLQQMISRFIT
ncbi:methyl-accepting chemotaxis protein [Brevibacillus aydinogluensis]|uniref:Methyl-accepting chemotaxis protein n=1 Tax=Brevibacillus aydinogluensis TaxID=927786 RepID=A0AA48M8J4_9BACL|nr:methyl-accepting chemotaxis protein [Brevibacillus aydinogluensis]CAJ1002615.1 Methyl-accepting chemotaxis protein [Brevibacillus aydinogluensis]